LTDELPLIVLDGIGEALAHQVLDGTAVRRLLSAIGAFVRLSKALDCGSARANWQALAWTSFQAIQDKIDYHWNR
jgi:hypothetical protein